MIDRNGIVFFCRMAVTSRPHCFSSSLQYITKFCRSASLKRSDKSSIPPFAHECHSRSPGEPKTSGVSGKTGRPTDPPSNPTAFLVTADKHTISWPGVPLHAPRLAWDWMLSLLCIGVQRVWLLVLCRSILAIAERRTFGWSSWRVCDSRTRSWVALMLLSVKRNVRTLELRCAVVDEIGAQVVSL